MDALLPNLVKTARTIAMQSNPGTMANMSADEEREFDEYLLNTTKGIFSGGGGGLFDLLGGGGAGAGAGAGDGGGMGGLESLLGGLGGLAGGGGGGGAGGGERVNAKFDIHEDVEVDMPDFFNNRVFTVKFHAKTFDPELNGMKKKKKKIDVTLPAGSPDNFVLHIPNQGHYDSITKTTGSLYIHFNCVRDSQWKSIFRRQNQMLTMAIPIESFKSDGFSFQRTIPHPSGKAIQLTVSPSVLENEPLGINGRELITIPGFGFPRCGSTPAGALQIRVFFDPEKMEYHAGDFVIQSRFSVSSSMEAFANLNSSQSIRLNVTNPSAEDTGLICRVP
jgi:DnaJ-class molecular chaperone